MPRYKPTFPRVGARTDLRRGLVGEWLFHENSGPGSNSPSAATFMNGTTWADSPSITPTQITQRVNDDPLPGVGVHLDAGAGTPGIGLGDFSVGDTGSLFFHFHLGFNGGAENLAWGSPGGSTTNESFALVTAAGNALRVLNDHGFDTTSAFNEVALGLHTVALTVSGASVKLWWDGLLVIDHTEGTGVTEAFGTLQLGRRFTTSTFDAAGSTYYAAAAWDRPLVDQDVAALNSDPYALWRGASRTIVLMDDPVAATPHRTVTP